MATAMNPPSAAITPEVIAAEVKAFVERSDMTAELLYAALRVDAHGAPYNPRVDLGVLAGPARGSDPEQLARLKSQTDFALLKEPSRRWARHVRARSMDLRQRHAAVLDEWCSALYANAAIKPAAWLRQFATHLDAEVATLRRAQSEAQAALKRIDDDLRPLQAHIEAALNATESETLMARLMDLVSTVVQAFGRSVGLVDQVAHAQRLVNEREERGFNLDVIAAALGLLQAARAWALGEVSRIADLRGRCAALELQLAQRRALALQCLGRHPYAQVDASQPEVADRIGSTVDAELPSKPLAHYANFDAARLDEEFSRPAADLAQAAVARLNWLSVIEMAAEATGTPSDLALEAVQMAMNHAGRDGVDLIADAQPQEWLIAGVEDETNPPLAFSSASLVNVGRRDQLQVLHVQTGIKLPEVIAFLGAAAALDQASRQRNFYVLPALVLDDPARRAFALALACGFVVAEAGQFVMRDVSLDAETGGADDMADRALGPVTLAERVESALEVFAGHPDWVDAVNHTVDQLSLPDLAERLKVWLGRNRDIGRGPEDRLRREFAGHIRERLAVVNEQLRYAGPASVPASMPLSVVLRRDGVEHTTEGLV